MDKNTKPSTPQEDNAPTSPPRKYVSEFAPSQKDKQQTKSSPPPAQPQKLETQEEKVALAPTPQTKADYANFGRRLFASILDGIIFSLGYGIVSFPIMAILTGSPFSESRSDAQITLAPLISILLNIIYFLAFSAYFVYFIGKKGQTPGKKALGIKVVKLETNAPPGYIGAFLREVVGKFLSAAVIGLGYLWMLWDEKKQTWHDKIAGTIVIRT